jgi:glycosyltransferase 2 family protein
VKKRYILGIAVTLVCLYFVFRGIDFKELWSLVSRINPWILLLTVALYLGGYYIRAVRWHFLLKHIKPFKAQELFPYLVMGFMMNNVFPARLGEFARAYLTGMKKGISKTSAFATIMIERVFDGLVMIAFFIIGYLSFHYIHDRAQEIINVEILGRQFGIKEAVMIFAIFGSFVFIAIFALSALLIFKKEPTVKFLHGVLSKFPGKLGDKFTALIDNFIEGLGVMRKKSDLLTVFFYSAAAWSVEVFTYWLMAQAMGVEINFLLVCLIMAVANFAIMVPSTSGGVGPFEFFGVGIMLLFSYPKETATAYVVMIHSMILLPIIVLGVFFMFREGLDFKKLLKAKEEEKNV